MYSIPVRDAHADVVLEACAVLERIAYASGVCNHVNIKRIRVDAPLLGECGFGAES